MRNFIRVQVQLMKYIKLIFIKSKFELTVTYAFEILSRYLDAGHHFISILRQFLSLSLSLLSSTCLLFLVSV